MSRLRQFIMMLVLCFGTSTAGAQIIGGSLGYYNAVNWSSGALTPSSFNVEIWTNSYQDGLNFDPVLSLWRDDQLVAVSDDNFLGLPGQTSGDAALILNGLPAGQYWIYVTAKGNVPRGTTLGEGFTMDELAPIPFPPGTGASFSYYFVSSPVPEPATWAMLLAGLAGLAGAGRGRSKVHRQAVDDVR